MTDVVQNAPVKSVLLVDDNETYRKINKTALVSAGYTVYEAEHGMRALEIARVEKPQLILTDIYMPVMDGMALLSELKKDVELLKIPVVMLTNVQEELDKAVLTGAEEALLKSSLTPHQVVDVCNKYLTPTAS